MSEAMFKSVIAKRIMKAVILHFVKLFEKWISKHILIFFKLILPSFHKISIY